VFVKANSMGTNIRYSYVDNQLAESFPENESSSDVYRQRFKSNPFDTRYSIKLKDIEKSNIEEILYTDSL